MTLPSPLTNRRAITAFAILCGILLVALSGVAVAVAAIEAARAEIRNRQEELAALDQRALAIQRNQRANASLPVGEPYLAGANFALAANAFQQRVVSLVESTGGVLVVVGIDPAGAIEPAGRRAIVQVTAEMTIDALQETLYRLESEAPLVFVESLNIDARAQNSASTASPSTLRVEMRVAGYFRGGAR